jgi:hypothetical protein
MSHQICAGKPFAAPRKSIEKDKVLKYTLSAVGKQLQHSQTQTDVPDLQC